MISNCRKVTARLKRFRKPEKKRKIRGLRREWQKNPVP